MSLVPLERGHTVAMAIDARRIRARDGLRLIRLVRVVAGNAGESSPARRKTFRLAKPVRRTREFKFIVVARTRCVIEIPDVLLKRLARNIREDAAAVDRKIRRQAHARRLKMAWKTDLVPPLRGKTGWIDNQAFQFRRGSPGDRGSDMALSGAMASLAIDSLRHVHREFSSIVHTIRAGCHFGIRVMAEHAAIGGLTAETGVRRRVVSGTHRPVSALFGIPGERQFDQLVTARTTEVASRVIAGAEPIVDCGAEGIGDFSVEADLVAFHPGDAVFSRD